MTAHDAYLEERVLSADPVELIRMLYRAAVEAIGTARRHLALGDIRARSAAISRTIEILAELSASLDYGRASEVSRQLDQLYDYIGGRLLEANIQQEDAPLGEALQLLETLAEAWRGVPGVSPVEAKPAATAPATLFAWNPVVAESQPQPPTNGWSF